MIRLSIACALLVLMTGCSRNGEFGAPSMEAAPVPLKAGSDESKPQRRTLAYAHSVDIETSEEKVAVVHEAALAACRAATADLCEVLVSRLQTGDRPSSLLKFRAKPSGIPKLIAALSQQGEVTNRATTAEDLAGPLRDGEKKLAMLTSYRDELETLRKRPGNDVDALIKVTQELAKVQSELEAATGEQAVLVRRVETEILTVSIDTGRKGSFWRPIVDATSGFRQSLGQGISTAITGVAFLLPWSLVIGVMVWIARKLWRRRKTS